MPAANPWRRPLALLAVVALVPAAAAAKKGSPNIPLAYTPTTAVAEASAAPTSEMRAVPAALLISDDRGLADKAVIGSRSDDDDRRSELKATNDVAGFVESALTKQARDWSFVIADPAEAGVLLVGKITQFQVDETNQAVGATYSAEVALDYELRDRAGKKLAGGTFVGDASRYGKKFSTENTNEVVSDALAESFANALGDPTFRAAWGGSPAAPAAPGDAAPLTPEAALRELKSLIADGRSESALQDYLRGKTLTRALGADDLAAWKAAGVPESVVRVAVGMRVQ
ncbi:MAG TPA: hypothetical protein VF121_04665 [Thermoanaerobaculia bacterium]|nr:hypothetical protein [Thermoanaerobaculia bacterium]